MTTYETARCWACNSRTTYDPTLVPRVNGAPLCLACVTRVNELLTGDNVRPFVLRDGTYVETRPWDTETGAVERFLDE